MAALWVWTSDSDTWFLIKSSLQIHLSKQLDYNRQMIPTDAADITRSNQASASPQSLTFTSQTCKTDKLRWHLQSRGHFCTDSHRCEETNVSCQQQAAKWSHYWRTLSSALLSAFLSMCRRNSALFLGQRPWVQPNCLAWKTKRLSVKHGFNMPCKTAVNPHKLLRFIDSFHRLSKGVLRWSSWQLLTPLKPNTPLKY